MPGEEKELENMNPEDFLDMDSLEDFVDIEDLESLEGMEEFMDLADLEDVAGDDVAALSEEPDAEEPKKRAVPELFDETPEEEIPSEEASITQLFDGAPEELSEEIPMPDMFDETPKKDISEEISIPEMPDEVPGEEPVEEVPMPDMSDEMPEEELSGDIPMPDMSDEMPEEELSGEVPMPDMSDEMPEEELSGDIPMPDMSGDMPEEELSEETLMPEQAEEEIPMPEADTMNMESENDASAIQDEEAPISDMPSESESLEDIDMLTDTDIQEGDIEMAQEDNAPDVTDIEGVGQGEDSGSMEGDDALDMMLDDLLGDLNMKDTPDNDSSSSDASDDLPEEEIGDMIQVMKIDNDEEQLDIAIPESADLEEPEEKKPGLLKRLFGNVVTDEIAEAERKAMEEEEAKAAEQAELEEQKKAEKEEAKAAAAAEKEAKKAAKKEEKAAKKAEKAAQKEEKKAKREEEEAAELEITGKLNKVGVAIIAVVTVIFLVTEILGTKLYGYNSTTKRAKEYFEMGKYTQAYETVMGTDMRTKDPEGYDKIRTVMQVQRSIDSYNNYNEMNFYPDALNALIRGIQRYDSNLEHGRELEVVGQMDSCKEEIVSLLQSEFGVSETEARSLLTLEKPQYTEKVVAIALARNS